jgi:hypothetical protein
MLEKLEKVRRALLIRALCGVDILLKGWNFSFLSHISVSAMLPFVFVSGPLHLGNMSL